MGNLIVLSNNLWNRDINSKAWEERGEDCSAEARVGGLVQAYTSVVPDIAGFQEMTPKMQWLIEERMCNTNDMYRLNAKYEIISGGFTMLMYRSDKLRLIESGHLVFDKKIHGYDGEFNDVDSKGYTYGVFEDRESLKKTAVFSVHLWWMSDDKNSKNYREGSGFARTLQIQKVIEKSDEIIEKYGCPVIVMGDLNDKLGSKPLNEILSVGFEETHKLCTGERNDEHGYHYCFADGWKHYEPKPYEEAIDHILLANKKETKVNKFLRYTNADFEKLSDHFPVYVDITL